MFNDLKISVFTNFWIAKLKLADFILLEICNKISFSFVVILFFKKFWFIWYFKKSLIPNVHIPILLICCIIFILFSSSFFVVFILLKYSISFINSFLSVFKNPFLSIFVIMKRRQLIFSWSKFELRISSSILKKNYLLF